MPPSTSISKCFKRIHSPLSILVIVNELESPGIEYSVFSIDESVASNAETRPFSRLYGRYFHLPQRVLASLKWLSNIFITITSSQSIGMIICFKPVVIFSILVYHFPTPHTLLRF